MARYKPDRSHSTLFVEGSLDGLLPLSSVARTIWEGLAHVNFSGFEALYRNDEAGCRAIAPKRLAAVWILSLMRGNTSSVELARRCSVDIELRWLLGDARVEKSTLCSFRKDHVDLLKEVSTQLLASLARADLLPGEHIAVDGSVIRAASSCGASVSRKALRRRIEKLGRVIEAKLTEEPSGDEAAVLERKKARLEKALTEMTAMGKTGAKDRITVTEPEASKKRLKNGAFAPAHNVQVVTDMDTGAIIHSEIIEQNNDCAQLEPQLRNAEDVLEEVAAQLDDSQRAAPKSVCADAGYFDTHQLVALEERGITTLVPDHIEHRRPPGVTEEYLAEAFTYDEARDTMICPQGKSLKPGALNPGKTARTYQASKHDCAQCPAKGQCCPKAKRGRCVNRPLYADQMATIAQRIATPEGQRCMRQRKIAAEGAYARTVHLLNWRRCRTWGKRGAQAEAIWRQITHNLMLLTGHWQPITGPETASG